MRLTPRRACRAPPAAGQGLALEREPSNEFDPNAVAVRTLDDVALGYVPRAQTSAFPFRLCFGAVHSVGQAAGGPWGVSVDVQPSVPPMTVLAVPDSLRRRCRVAPLLHGAAWDRVRAEALAAGGQRCAVSGAPAPAVSERWEFDDGERVMRLAGFAALAPEVVRVQHMAEAEAGAGEEGGLRAALAAMNGWGEDDVARYLRRTGELAAARSARGPWRLDLRALLAMGLEVPPELAAAAGGGG